jgi:protein tyrosine/serine phosphatase
VTVLAWHGCMNVRDVGGLATADGRVTAHGALVRSDSVSQLRRAGWDALVAHGVRTIVDLRFAQERDDDPPRELDVEVVHAPLFGDTDADIHEALQRRIDAARGVTEQYRLFYGDWLERYPGGFATAVRAIANAAPGAVVVHCVGGKDRTGVVVALALEVAGVSRELIALDYEATERSFGEEGVAPAAGMDGVLDDLEQRHGGVRAYLRRGGASDAELDRLRERLLA